MFYCKECAERNDWPQTMFQSWGMCEICDKTRSCSDYPSSALPLRPAVRPSSDDA